MRNNQNRIQTKREEFADGSAVVTYSDGSMLILESNLARESIARETHPVNYNDPPPPE